MGAGQPPYAVALADVAKNGRLVVYTGAGLSRGHPTDIPAGAEVARRCHERLVNLLGADALDGADPSNLTSVADVVAALDGGLDLLRRTAVGVAEFTTADPNFGHEALALLLLEGLVLTITTNWDDCIERAGGAERVLAVISDQDRQQIHAPALLKVHGCATRPDTVLLTSEDLTNPPVWVRDEINARLADSHVVFVGIGDVAGYVRSRIEEAAEAVGAGGAVYVVSPSVGDKWDENQWAEVLPDLPADRRFGLSADEFLDVLAAACVRLLLREIAEAIEEQSDALAAFNRARGAFDVVTPVHALRWLRACAVPRQPGRSVLRQQSFTSALIALGVLGPDGVELHPLGRAITNDSVYEILVGVGNVTASRCRREAEARLIRYRSEGGDTATSPTFLVAGAVGRFASPGGLEESVLGDSDPRDLVAGPLAVSPILIRAEDLAA
jgi:hypothetical protein